jgi:hypothetical protein
MTPIMTKYKDDRLIENIQRKKSEDMSRKCVYWLKLVKLFDVSHSACVIFSLISALSFIRRGQIG